MDKIRPTGLGPLLVTALGGLGHWKPKTSFSLSLLLVVQGLGTAAAIVDGVPAPEYREGALVQKDGLPSCSGALVAPDMVLTAGHCIFALDARRITVEFPHLVGGVRRNARELINIYPTPKPWVFSRPDVALIRLDADVDLGSYPYPILGGVALGENIRSLGRKQGDIEQTGEMFISAAQTIFALDDNYYRTNPIIANWGDSGGPVFTTDVVPGAAPNVIVAVNSGYIRSRDEIYFTRVDAQTDLLKSYMKPPTCSVSSSDLVRLQMHRLKMIRSGYWTSRVGMVRYRLAFSGVASGWIGPTQVREDQTLPLDIGDVCSLTQHAQTHEGARDRCISGKIEVEERNLNSTHRSVEASMSYCYDATPMMRPMTAGSSRARTPLSLRAAKIMKTEDSKFI